jgi:hypothetical protein
MSIRPIHNLGQPSVEAVIARMGGAGIYLTTDLYAEYVKYADEQGVVPASSIVWGRALSACGAQRKTRRVNGKQVGAWLV